jgi:murein DD-endopeptidase MepM/ murein hydrolase activator NlpD
MKKLALCACLISNIAIAQEQQPLVTLQSKANASGDVIQAVAKNQWYGPVEVELSWGASSSNVKSSPALPQRWLLHSQQEKVLAILSQANPAQTTRFDAVLKAVPGQPNAQHNAQWNYTWPLPNGQGRMDQGFGGGASHQDVENYYAIDVTAPPGTAVFAARAGVVMATEGRFTASGWNRALMGKANYVRVLHSDGSMASYAHLQPNSITVRPGDQVNAGSQIGRVGATGYTTGPHLHFVVQVNRQFKLLSVPFRMQVPPGAAKRLTRAP